MCSSDLITDTRNARIVWQGYLDLPGRSAGNQGDQWTIGAVGGYARLSDRHKPYVVIDSSIDAWEFNFASQTGRMQASAGSMPSGGEEGEDCFLLSWNNGIAIGTGAKVGGAYRRLYNAGQDIGMVTFRHREGFASAANKVKLIAKRWDGGAADEVIVNLNWDTTLDWSGRFSVGASYSLGKDTIKYRIERTGAATNVDTEDWWSGATQFRVICVLHDINGNPISGALSYPNDYLLPHEVVIDSMFRFAPPLDRATASIDTGFTYQIDQLVYDDPVTMADVLDDLALTSPNMWWEVLEVTGSGNHRFNLNRYQTAAPPRYAASTADGWDAPGGEADLRNRVVIAWRDKSGEKQTSTYTGTVPELDQWGITRDADLINLADEMGSQANADRIGGQALTQVTEPPVSGTLTIARPILDMYAGRWVYPWEIRPGYDIIVSDIEMPAQTITEVAYRDSDASASLTVGEPELSTDQLVAMFSQRRRRRRRR